MVNSFVDERQKPQHDRAEYVYEARTRPTITVVDDDIAIRRALSLLLTTAGYMVADYCSAVEALEFAEPDRGGCYLLDLHLPDMNGIELCSELRARGCQQPFIMITGYGEVATAVEALQIGAVDYIEKPFDRQRLLERIASAVRQDSESRSVRRAIESLTAREREVLPMLAEGMLSKQIAKALHISPRTVEVHRRNIMHKMGKENVAQLVRTLTIHWSHDRR